MKKKKIVVISHAFVEPVNQQRWKELAKDPEYEVHLVTPCYWESTWFKGKKTYQVSSSQQGGFFVHAFSTTSKKNWNKFLFKKLSLSFKKIKPDLIYMITVETALVNLQILFYQKIFAPKAKVIFFSMNGKGVSLGRFHLRFIWNRVKKNTKAALVHYPDCLKVLRKAGYQHPIFLQTQIGVDQTLFFQNPRMRDGLREKLGMKNCFVIGYVGRLTADKGVDDLIDAFLKLREKGLTKNTCLLLVGDGPLKLDIEKIIEEKKLQHSILITGLVNQKKVPDYMNIMDLFFLGSKTTKHWIDTFPLVTVQAQICNVPVLASDSASLPWQLADTAEFFEEGNREQLISKIDYLIHNDDYRATKALQGFKRASQLFSTKMMTENFKKIVDQVLTNKFVFHQKNENYQQSKAYLSLE